MPHQLPQEQPDPALASSLAPTMLDSAASLQQQQPHQRPPSQQHSRSSRDLAAQSFPQQTDQPRLLSQPIQTSSSPPPRDIAPAAQTCAKCEQQMQGSFVRALGATYHLDCFRCMDCDQIVASKFFPIASPDTNQQHPLCERDYFRRLNLVCRSCGEALRGSYITALDSKYHIEHFTCSVCPTVFGPQDSYYEHDNKVYCHYHYSIQYAVKCAGCRTAILKQFVEINRNSQDEHWHPECYMIHKFWNVKLSITPQGEDEQQQTMTMGSEAVSPVSIASPTSLEQRTPEELRRTQQQMEEKVYQIWTVLSAFEESSAGCISEMLAHVSNGAYYDGVQMAERFILHVEILFSAIDDLEAQMKEVGDPSDLTQGREAKMLCKKIVNFFSLLSHTQESGVRRLGMTQELLSLVTGLAHYLKILIRIALTCALKLERQYHSKTVIARFLSKLMELANKDKCLRDLHGNRGAMDAEVTSDLCQSCRITIEDECFTFDHQNRWHPKCLICSGCAKPLADVYYDASFDASCGAVLCQQCKTPESQIGFSHVTKLEQYTFLLRVALIRLENLLHLKNDDAPGNEQHGRHLAASPTPDSGLMSSAPGLIRKDSRSKSYSSDDNRQYETIHLGDIKRVKSTHLDRKLSNSARFPRRQTVIEHQRRRPPPDDPNLKEEVDDATGVGMHDPTRPTRLDVLPEAGVAGVGGTSEYSPLEIEIIDEGEGVNDEDDDDEEQMDGRNVDAPATLSDLTEKLRIETGVGAKASPAGSLRMRSGLGEGGVGSLHLSAPSAANSALRRPRRQQYLNELSALELFIVKHLAVLTLAPIVTDYFTLEELLDLIGQRKQTLWGRFVKGLKTDKKKSKVEGTFGVPLEVLVERGGVDSALGAGPGRIRIPSFVDDSISAMRNMDMSVEGVFRKNGNIRRLKELGEIIDKDPSSVNLAEENPVQVAALLKKFLRDLPDPLLTFKLHRLFVVSQKMEDEEVRKMILHLTCCLLPKPNRDSMEAICLFLRWVASFSHVDEETGSKMDLHNLATVITPNVLYSKSKDPIKDESFLAIEAVMGLLEYQDEFCVVPEDLSLILNDQDLVESSMDLSSKDILKRCENLVRAKFKKSHSVGDLYPTDSQSHGQEEMAPAVNSTHSGSVGVQRQASAVHSMRGVTRENSMPVMIQQTPSFPSSSSGPMAYHPQQHNHQQQQRHYGNTAHGLSTSSPTPSSSAVSSSSLGPMRIPERPQVVSVGGGKGSTPMSL
ncbi:hypothetical protein BGZ99_008133 [Dissophora globulifera]|uniref:RhoGAP-domain-containing protein n=1 Tax=Dissophora globulifera TaxID=979702 RepID=A0A9P6RA00_9FUNG|nr:hypothetical protein BGZ99_008133 [Dissophora globulifera]